MENTFPARRYAAEIFNRQGRDCDLKSMTNRILRQPGNKVRHNAFSDYLTMKEMNRDGRLTDREKETWQHVLGACQPYYLYERNGKKPGTADYESRSESVVKLYVQWLKDEQPPREVLLFLYKKLNLKDLERSSTRGLYSALKAEVLRLCPQAEETLFGEDGKEQRIVKLYKTYASIINANQNNYDKFIYEETPEIRDRVNAFFALPDWEQLKGEKALFERIYGTSKRIVMPRTAAEILVRHLTEGDFPEPERTELIESLLRSLSTERMCRELDYRYEITLGSTQPGDIGDSPDFWQYFLMRGFGYRHVPVRGQWEEDYIYVKDGECYLPAYVDLMFSPSRVWQKAFVGWDEESQSIAVPVSGECSMPGGRRLRVEFHYHYCLYFVDGRQAVRPVLDFGDLRDCEGHLEDPREFFFLLAVTSITWKDRQEAVALIEKWLGRIPAHPITRPVIARLLAADNDRLPGDARAVYYGEQERFCFRAVVGDEGINVFRQVNYGWQDILFRQPEFGWEEAELPRALGRKAKGGFGDTCETGEEPADRENGNGRTEDFWEETAGEILECLRQPRPARKDARVVAGMGRDEKMAAVLDAMGYDEKGESYLCAALRG